MVSRLRFQSIAVILLVAGAAPPGGGTISGRVVDLSGRPQPDVTIVAVRSGKSRGDPAEAMSDAQGSFRLDGLERGQRYLILATATAPAQPLIGRVAAIPPDDSVVIEIARPFTASYRSNPRTVQPIGQARAATAPVTPAPNRSRQDLISENRLELPWDMPAPPSEQAAARPPTATGGPEKTQWRPAGRSVHKEARLGRPIFDLAPEAAGGPAAAQIAETKSDEHNTAQSPDATGMVDPRRPLARPREIAGSPTSDERRTLVTKPAWELEPAEPEKPTTPQNERPAAGKCPSCEFHGDRLVDFRLPDLKLQPIAFSRIRGRLVLIDFWGTWCSYCLKTTPHLIDLQRRYGPQGLQVIGIAYEQGDLRERVSRVQEVREQLGINYPLLLGDSVGACPVRDQFRIHSYPTLVLLDKSGRVLWRCEDADPKKLDRLENLLKNQLAAHATGYNQ